MENLCPVCGNTANEACCGTCGWDLRPVFGLSGQITVEHEQKLAQARLQWLARMHARIESIDKNFAKLAALLEQGALPNQAAPEVTNTDDVFLALGYQDNGDGTVTDTSTGLTWMRFCVGQRWENGEVTGTAKAFGWKEALETPAFFNRIAFAGYSNWRVPTTDELKTLIQHHWEEPLCDLVVFPGTPSDWFWSSSPYANNSDHAWGVGFGSGVVD